LVRRKGVRTAPDGDSYRFSEWKGDSCDKENGAGGVGGKRAIELKIWELLGAGPQKREKAQTRSFKTLRETGKG